MPPRTAMLESIHNPGEQLTFQLSGPCYVVIFQARVVDALYEVARKVISATGSIRLFGRNTYFGMTLANTEVTFWERIQL
jgi:hypothetical protein